MRSGGVLISDWAEQSTVANYERGEAEPSASALSAYSQLGISLNWLLTGEGEMFADPSKATAGPKPRGIDPAVFRQVGRLVMRVHKEEWIKLPTDAVLDEQADAYNALLARAEDPSDTDELMALLAWLEARLKKRLRAAAEEPGTGKRQA
ncbi:MAG: XRE family transcriptional regulator [Alphaproteobacteria bacterium]|nr:XRE family transcriptional regulator [Alphaproteobacteria bacterium]